MRRPVILAHGIAPFDALWCPVLRPGVRRHLNPHDKFDYFTGIASYLQVHGYSVYSPRVPWAATATERAAALKMRVDGIRARTGADKVHIIAHSMGGLDARHMIVDFDMADHVATLTTVGTPHRGTSFANVGLAKMGWLIGAAKACGVDLAGFWNFSTEAAAAFNDRALDAEAQNPVHYATYAAHQDYAHVFTPLKLSWRIIAKREGPNDGLVPMTSAAWTDRLKDKVVRQETFPIPADHLNELAWWDLSKLRPPRQPRKPFKAAVRDVYLKMARDADQTTNPST